MKQSIKNHRVVQEFLASLRRLREKKIILYSFLLMLFFTSCEKVIDLDLNDAGKEICC